jgi:nucleoside 2-deoxyribosyltransferase
MKIYVATRMREDASHAIEAAQRSGIEVTHDWTRGPRLTRETGPEIASVDIEAVRACDALLLLWWPGMTGAYVELGAALALGKRVVVAGADMRDCAFLYHPLVSHVFDVWAALEALLGRDPAPRARVGDGPGRTRT